MISLVEYSKNVHSQYGEDGILEKLFEVLEIENGYFCEFGAWDGKHLSNTFHLYEKGWLGLYIEGDAKRYLDLKRNIQRSGMSLVRAFVAREGEDSLDNILEREKPDDTTLDLLSIDIDSDDLPVWKSLRRHRAKVVVIECNPSIPSDVRYENPVGQNRGNSALSTFEHAISSGYELVAYTHSNLIFLDQKENKGRVKVYTLSDLPANRGYRFFFGYDGTLLAYYPGRDGVVEQEFLQVPWHQAVFSQPISVPFRNFDEGSRRDRLAGFVSRISAGIRRPLSALRHLQKQMRR